MPMFCPLTYLDAVRDGSRSLKDEPGFLALLAEKGFHEDRFAVCEVAFTSCLLVDSQLL